MEQEKIKVFVVDDSAFMRRIIKDMVESDPDIEVIGTAMNGKLALLKLERLKPDVITLDVEMPGMSGLQVLESIRTRQPELPVSFARGPVSSRVRVKNLLPSAKCTHSSR